MNDTFPSYMDNPSAYYARCQRCGSFEPEEFVTLVQVADDEIEVCQECHAIMREEGIVVKTI